MVSDTQHEESLNTQSKRQGVFGDLLAQMSRKDQGVAGDGCKRDSVQGSHLCFLLSGASFSPPAGVNAAGISASPSRGKGAPRSDWRGSSPPPPRMTPGGPGSRQRMGSPFGPCGEGGVRRGPYLEGGLLRHPVAAPELLITKEYQTQVGRPHGWCGSHDALKPCRCWETPPYTSALVVPLQPLGQGSPLPAAPLHLS